MLHHNGKLLLVLGSSVYPLILLLVTRDWELDLLVPHAKGKTVTKMWSGRGQCSDHVVIISDRKTQALEITGCILHEARGQDHCPMGGWGFLCRQ